MNLRKKAIDALRIVGTDMINEANSGHPGIVLGAAPMLEALYSDFMNVNVLNPKWINRDRFVLSAGHGVPLLYSMLHFAGFNLSMEDLKKLRKYESLTPGHPECDVTSGIDVSTGPLGQGLSMGVGLAMAETFLANKFNKTNYNIIDHYTYVLIGDGDLQEGISQESMSLAGHLSLDKLIVLYDSNNIQLDGSTSLTISEDVCQKYTAMGWNYILVNDGNNSEEIISSIAQAKSQNSKPTIIEIKTVIGDGTKFAGSSACHGAPIGKDSSVDLKLQLNWDYPPFEVPIDVYSYFNDKIAVRGNKKYDEWVIKLVDYERNFKDDYNEFIKVLQGSYVSNIELNFEKGHKEATRISGGKMIELFSKEFPTLVGGSADLTKSTKAKGLDGDFTKSSLGRNINFGVREHAMGAIVNGITLHGGLRAFSGGFFVFSDYMKPSMRLASLMKLPSIFVFTHDSIAVGEDGPTHEPIEQLTGLRALPNMNVIRPCDANETFGAFKLALASEHTPTTIVLTRQDVTVVDSNSVEMSKGAYIVRKEKGTLDGIILACGSEVELAIKASEKMEFDGINIRVVSIPSTYLFDKQSKEYKNLILPKNVKTMAIEMGSTLGWYKYADIVLGIDCFGASANASVLLEKYGFIVDNVVEFYKNN